MKKQVILSQTEWNKVEKELKVLAELRKQDTFTIEELQYQARLLKDEKYSLGMRKEGLDAIKQRLDARDNDLFNREIKLSEKSEDIKYYVNSLKFYFKYAWLYNKFIPVRIRKQLESL